MHVTITLETPDHFIEAKGQYIERSNSSDGDNWKEWERTSFDITYAEDVDCNELPPSYFPVLLRMHGDEIVSLLDEAAAQVTEGEDPEYDRK